jgi:NAD(P)-dependent dehydrogenase (short-subunit alcohol dehydrogenase family)
MPASPLVLIIGASRGLGLALTREWLSRGCTVIATARSASQAGLQEAAATTSDGRLTIEELEMTDVPAVEALRERLSGHELDLLFVNAGVANGPGDRVDQVSTEEFTRIMVTNALSPMRIVESLGDLVRHGGTIAIMSSSMGSVALNETGGWEVYRASKAALNTLMRSYAARHVGDERALALVDPGWVRTDMGGSDASLSVEESIPGVVDALAARGGQPGLRYFNYKGETVPW